MALHMLIFHIKENVVLIDGLNQKVLFLIVSPFTHRSVLSR